MKDDMKFTIRDEQGKTIECELLFTFESDETGKTYIVYTDNTMDEDGCARVYANIYNPDGKIQFLSIETDREWKIVDEVLEQIRNDENA